MISSLVESRFPNRFGVREPVRNRGTYSITQTYGRYEHEPETSMAHPYKPQGYEQAYDLFDPEVITVYMYLAKSVLAGESPVGEKLSLSGLLKENESYIQEGNSVLLILRERVSRDDDGGGLWKNISLQTVERALDAAEQGGNKRRRGLERHLGKHDFIGSIQMIICGSKKNFWTEPQVDISAFLADAQVRETFFTDMSSTLRIDLLNRAIFHSEEMSGGRIKSLPFDATLFAFPTEDHQGSGSSAKVPTRLFIDYDVERESEAKVLSGGGLVGYVDDFDGITIVQDEAEVEMKLPEPPPDQAPDKEDLSYRPHLDDLITIIARYMGFQLTFLHLYSGNYKRYKKNAARIRKEIQGLQSDINALLLADDRGKKAVGSKTRGKGKLPTGDDIIYRSSVYSSSITEIDESVSNMTLFLNDRSGIMDRIETEVHFDRGDESNLSDFMVYLPEELEGGREGIISAFARLVKNLSNSQDRLRNTIDVFTTYRESKRRKQQKKTVNRLNLIFSALAIVELADFIGGLVTYAMGHDDWGGAMMMFAQAFGFLLFIAFIIYLVFIRRFWKEN